ncbi:MAG: cytochrome c [Proteobacteria bacterium]|nr:cytochrome c [Pseudomonadota bacterium]HQR03655.1 cytochrome c [Rhodocyclaceae bacterium]
MSQDMETRAQARENEDPEEAIRPMPLTILVVALGMVLWAVVYILSTEPLTLSAYGDQRTRAELAGATPAAAGAAGAAVDGQAVFASRCAACHQATGSGLPGVFPPLDGSEWVQGEPRILANILLHGITGSISVKGATYQGAMPSFHDLPDAELAAVLSYVRGSWSNKAPAVTGDLFAQERKASNRTTPFEGGEALKALIK